MNVTPIQKPHPYCPIPYGHPCHRGYVPAEQTDIRQTWARAAKDDLADDYERVIQQDWLSAPGGWRP